MSKGSDEYKHYNETVNNYQVGQGVTLEKKCFAYAATCLGDTIVEVNGHRLFPSAAPATIVGDSISIAAPDGELFKGVLTIKFVAPIGAAPNVEITQLYYIDEKLNRL